MDPNDCRLGPRRAFVIGQEKFDYRLHNEDHLEFNEHGLHLAL